MIGTRVEGPGVGSVGLCELVGLLESAPFAEAGRGRERKVLGTIFAFPSANLNWREARTVGEFICRGDQQGECTVDSGFGAGGVAYHYRQVEDWCGVSRHL